MKNTLVTYALAISMSGCAAISVQDLRSEPPSKTATVSGNYEDIGMCAAAAMQTSETSDWSSLPGNLTYEVIHLKSKKQVAVTGKMAGRGYTLIDLLFYGVDKGKTVIESRQGGFGDMRKGGATIEEKAWPMINKCIAEHLDK